MIEDLLARLRTDPGELARLRRENEALHATVLAQRQVIARLERERDELRRRIGTWHGATLELLERGNDLRVLAERLASALAGEL